VSGRAVDGRIATMADSAWALFGSDDEVEAVSGDDVDGTRSGGANKKRPRAREGSAAVGSGVGDVASAWARDRASGPATAADHAYFAPSRALWPADASLGAPADPRRADAALADFVAALADDAAARVPSVAAQLRRHRPEGHAAADALVSAADAVASRDWSAAARAAVASQAAHSRQLDVGNWPHECWQRSHVFALGFQVAAELHAPNAHQGAAVTDEGTARARAASSSEFGALSEDPAAAAGVRASAERWSPADRLGRVALEALAMAALATDPDEIPSWLGAGVLLAERACAAALAKTRASRADVAGSNPARDVPDDPNAYLIPDAIPPDAPAIDPSRAVPRASADHLTVAEFHARFVAPGRAVVLEGCLTPSRGWAPASEWRDLRALVRGDAAGERVVPVEYGGFGDGRGTGVSTLGDFVRDFLLPSNAAARGSVPSASDAEPNVDGRPSGEKMKETAPAPGAPARSEDASERPRDEPRVAYVSQHALFHQIPSLQRLFSVPAYTLGRLRADAGAVNAWLGTKDTATALHRDPYLNLLAQTAGFKYVRLYADDQTEMLYPDAAVRGGNDNTFTRSAVDVEAPDLVAFPRFVDATFRETLLRPGDVLFMPRGMWHYVRGLTTSFSVNFWWN
jgi:hypothetical protein